MASLCPLPTMTCLLLQPVLLTLFKAHLAKSQSIVSSRLKTPFSSFQQCFVKKMRIRHHNFNINMSRNHWEKHWRIPWEQCRQWHTAKNALQEMQQSPGFPVTATVSHCQMQIQSVGWSFDLMWHVSFGNAPSNVFQLNFDVVFRNWSTMIVRFHSVFDGSFIGTAKQLLGWVVQCGPSVHSSERIVEESQIPHFHRGSKQGFSSGELSTSHLCDEPPICVWCSSCVRSKFTKKVINFCRKWLTLNSHRLCHAL